MKKQLFVLLLLAFACQAPAQTANEVANNFAEANTKNCASLQNYDEEQTRGYILSQGRTPSDLTCFAAAFTHLDNFQSPATISMLIELIDYRFPETNTVVVQTHAAPPGSQYPAVQALSMIGRVAAPQLQESLVDPARSEPAKVNAITALQLIYGYRASRPSDFILRVGQYADRAKKEPSVRGTLVAELNALDEEYVRAAKAAGRKRTDEFHSTWKFGDAGNPGGPR